MAFDQGGEHGGVPLLLMGIGWAVCRELLDIVAVCLGWALGDASSSNCAQTTRFLRRRIRPLHSGIAVVECQLDGNARSSKDLSLKRGQESALQVQAPRYGDLLPWLDRAPAVWVYRGNAGR